MCNIYRFQELGCGRPGRGGCSQYHTTYVGSRAQKWARLPWELGAASPIPRNSLGTQADSSPVPFLSNHLLGVNPAAQKETD